MSDQTPPNLISAFLEQSRRTPERAALVFEDETYSYQMIHDLAASFAVRFTDAGLGRETLLDIETPDLAVLVAGALAAASVGARICMRGAAGTCATANANAANVSLKIGSGQVTESEIFVDETWSPANLSSEVKSTALSDANGSDLNGWLMCGFDDDGTPRGMSLRTLSELSKQDELLNTDDVSRIAIAGDPRSQSALSRILCALAAGVAVVENAQWDVWRTLGVTHVFAHFMDLAGLIDAAQSDAKIDHLIVAGGHLSDDMIGTTLKRFGTVTHSYDHPMYGQCFATTYQDGEKAAGTASFSKHVEVGLEGDHDAAPLSVRPAFLANAKAHLPGAIAAKRSGGGLEIIAPNALPMVGTSQETVSAGLLEHAISTTKGIVHCAVFISPKPGANDILCFAEFAQGVNRPQTVERAKLAVRNSLGETFVPSHIRPIDRVPSTKDGWPDRASCAQQILRASTQ